MKKNTLISLINIQLFNGDFVDRGSFSVECIFTIFSFKLLYPNHFFLARGKSGKYIREYSICMTLRFQRAVLWENRRFIYFPLSVAK